MVVADVDALTFNPDTVRPEGAHWKAELLRKIESLRAEKKRAIIFIDERGAMLIFRAEPAGTMDPP